MDSTIRSCLLVLTFIAVTACLYITRDLITPFAIAIFIWLIIDTFARWIDGLSSKLPYWFALIIAVLTVIAAIVGIIIIVADTTVSVVDDYSRYQERISEIFSWAGNLTGQENLSFTSLNQRFGIMDKVQSGLSGLLASVQGVLSNFMLIAFYVIFLFAAQSTFPKKMDDLFPDLNSRAQAQKVGERIRHSVEKYIGVQTLISLMQTVVSYIAMAALGLDNALFWALVIFILNYIPIVGGLAAVALPCMFGLVQFGVSPRLGILAGALFGAQFVIGNTIQPKMMGDSMNLSALVVVLSLTLWGAMWGGVGAFLSAPLTVIIMIILAQFPTTRWIAVLLSADGEPDMDEVEKKAAKATPSL